MVLHSWGEVKPKPLLLTVVRKITTIVSAVVLSFTILVSAPASAETTITQLGSAIDGEAAGDRSGFSVALSSDGNRIATASFGNSESGSRVRLFDWNGSSWDQVGGGIYGEETGDKSVFSLSLSSDGNRVAVGDVYHGSSIGQVRIYEYVSDTWTKVGGDILGIDGEVYSGFSVALSADGNRVAIGARGKDIRVFDYDEDSDQWSQVGSPSNGQASANNSEQHVSLSPDGNRLVIGARNPNSNLGHVRVFDWVDPNWVQVGSDIDGAESGGLFGFVTSLSSDGKRVAIGAPGPPSGTGLIGKVRIFDLIGSDWVQVGNDIVGDNPGDRHGFIVFISSDGQRLAVSAKEHDAGRGKVRIYDLIDSQWVQVGPDIDGEDTGDQNGWGLSLNADGNRVAIGAYRRDGANGTDSGYARVFSITSVIPPTAQQPVPYSGPLITSVGIDDAISVSGNSFVINGQRLGSVSKVVIQGQEVEIVSKANDSIQILLPSGLAPGTHDVHIQSSIGNLTYLDGITITESAVPESKVSSVEYGEMTAWSTRVNDSQAKVYVKFPTVGEKVRISHQTGGSGEYNTVYVKTTSSETMDGLRIVEGIGTYIVRTIDLSDINRIRVTVADETPVQVRYNK